MKKVLLSLLIIFTCSTKAQWVQTSGANNNSVKTYSRMGSKIFAGTYYGTGVFLSTDDGLTWNSTTNFSTKDVVTLINDGTNVYVGTNGDGVFKSSDNGTTWNASNNGLTKLQVYALSLSGTKLYAGTAGGGVFLSTDGGTSWNPANSGIETKTIYTLLSSGTNLFAGSNNNGIYRSTDNGASWTPFSLPGRNIITLKQNNNKLYVGTWGEGVYYSSDNGTSWTQIKNGMTNLSVYTLSFDSKNNIYAGAGSNVFFYKDNDTNWIALNDSLPESKPDVWSVEVIDRNILAGTGGSGIWKRSLEDILLEVPLAPVTIAATAISGTGFTANWNEVVGAAGYYLDVADNFSFTNFIPGFNNKDVGNVHTYVITNLEPNIPHYYRVRAYNAAGTSDNSNTTAVTLVEVENRSNNLPIVYCLEQNYPNPFNPTTVIGYQLPVAGMVTLKIYDVLGKEVATLIDNYQQAGTYNYQLSTNNFQMPSGIYFYRLNVSDPSLRQNDGGQVRPGQGFSDAKKFILLK